MAPPARARRPERAQPRAKALADDATNPAKPVIIVALPCEARYSRRPIAEGAYALDTAPMADLLTEQRISKPIVQALASMPADDPAHLYLRRPTPDAKDRFAAWITQPPRLTAANYAAFTPVLTSLKQLLEREAEKTPAP